MRDALKRLVPEEKGFSHVGLAYAVLAPIEPGTGKVLEERRDDWFRALEASEINGDYEYFYKRWFNSLLSPQNRAFSVALQTRLLIGHGNPAPSQVGLTLHHTWGVPYIPGSALKGLVASYMQITYGPEKLGIHPWSNEHLEPERAPYQGVSWDRSKILHGPGYIYRHLFGAPNTSTDRDYDLPASLEAYRDADGDYEHLYGETKGAVTFHDALLVPDGASKQPFAQDVMTVHQKGYYDSSGGVWPNDYEDPTPIQFLTVKPGVRFLFALSGPPGWTELAGRLLKAALCLWGVGGKTSAGYGHFDPTTWREELNKETIEDMQAKLKQEREQAEQEAQQAEAQAEAKESGFYQEFSAWLEENPDDVSKTKMPGVILSDWAPRFEELDTASRAVIWELIRKKSPKKNKKAKEALAELKALLQGQ